MARMLRFWLRPALLLLSLLCGCGSGYRDDSEYGIFLPPRTHDPAVELVDFTYQPASPVHAGDTLSFTARTSKPTDAGYLFALVRRQDFQNYYHPAELRDNGHAPDDVAGDGIWHGELLWDPTWQTVDNTEVRVELYWDDGYETQHLDAPPLTVLPAEEEP